jgi:hypothetical protein
MNKDKLKVSFEIDRYKVIGMLSRNCENAEEYNEIMGILEGKSEFVRDANGNEELASRICNYALDSILVENPDLALRKRLDKEQKGEDTPDVSNVIEIKGDDAKKLVDTLCGILRKDK